MSDHGGEGRFLEAARAKSMSLDARQWCRRSMAATTVESAESCE
jgi:hypothetical protein